MNVADDIHAWINRRLLDEYDRLEADCAEAIWLTPDHLDRLLIVKMDGLGVSAGDRVGWVACAIA